MDVQQCKLFHTFTILVGLFGRIRQVAPSAAQVRATYIRRRPIISRVYAVL